MSKGHTLPFLVCAAASVVGFGLLGTACRAADGSAAMPPQLVVGGAVTVATNASNAPVDFFAADGTTIQGLDPDLGQAIAKALGTRLNFVNVPSFSGLIPALQSGRFPFAMASMTDRADREEKVDFVDYLNVGLGLLVKAGNPEKIDGLGDLCGHTLAIETGSVADDIAKNQSKLCVAAGRPPIHVDIFPSQAQAQLQLRSGRADANMNDFPIIVFNADQSEGALQASTANFCTAPYGIALGKNQPQLVAALKNGLESVMASGEYAAILKRWSLSQSAISEVTVNDAKSGKAIDPVCVPGS